MSFFHTMLLLWIVCAPICYLTMRQIAKSDCGRWTQLDRLFAFVVSVTYGPIALCAMGIVALIFQLAKSPWANREAKW
ncbi:MAG: hypothetical protein WC058_02780 [Phycisphaeraceae bacterium]